MGRLIICSRCWNDIEWIKASLNYIEFWEPDLLYICEGNWDKKFPARSTDGTREIIEEYAKDKNNVFIINNLRENNNYRINQAETNNLVMKIAKFQEGDYMMIVDSDMFFLKDDILKMKKIIKEENIDYFSFDTYNFLYDLNQYSPSHENPCKAPCKLYKNSIWKPTCHITKNGIKYQSIKTLNKKKMGFIGYHYEGLRLQQRLIDKYKIGNRKSFDEFRSGERVKKLVTYDNKIQSEFAIDVLEELKYLQSNITKETISNPTITVFICVYNRPEYLEHSIQSILDQTYTDFEVIIIDDCSTNKQTLDILDDFKEKDNRIKIYHNEQNIGLTKSLNKGLTLSKGKYITRQDSDDYSDPTRLEKQIQLLKDNDDISFVSTACYIVDINDKIIKSVLTKDKKKISLLQKMKIRNALVDSVCMYKKEIFDKIGKYDEFFYISQTYNFNLRALQFFNATIIREPLYYVRNDIKNSIRFNKKANKFKKDNNIRELALERAEKYPIIKDNDT